ncbi:MAG: hypothetical protein NZT61_06130, partial [Deltaproteobacteria bacterium]|nr:hypothetical protein [Deltaproteobacteria bacterium]
AMPEKFYLRSDENGISLASMQQVYLNFIKSLQKEIEGAQRKAFSELVSRSPFLVKVRQSSGLDFPVIILAPEEHQDSDETLVFHVMPYDDSGQAYEPCLTFRFIRRDRDIFLAPNGSKTRWPVNSLENFERFIDKALRSNSTTNDQLSTLYAKLLSLRLAVLPEDSKQALYSNQQFVKVEYSKELSDHYVTLEPGERCYLNLVHGFFYGLNWLINEKIKKVLRLSKDLS